MNLRILKGYDKNIESSIRKDFHDFYEQKGLFYSFDFPLTIEWGDAGRVQKYAGEPLRYVLLDGKRPIGLFQGIVKRKFFISTLESGSTSGNGAIVYPTYGKAALKFFISDIIKKENFSSASIFIPEYVEIPSFSARKNYTYYIDLTKPLEKIMSNMKKQCRWAIRKAEKNNVKVEISDRDDVLEEAYCLVSETAKAKNIGIAPFKWIKELHKNFKTSGHSISAIASHDGESVAAGYFLCYDKKINWFFGGSKPYGDKLQAGNLVQMKVIEWGKNHGYRIYDMGGTHPYDSHYAKIDKFKSSFGGSLVTNYVLYKEKFYFPVIMRIKNLIGY